MPTSLTTSQVNSLRKLAKKLAREEQIPHHQSLDRLAHGLGYKNWSLLHKHSIPDLPKHSAGDSQDVVPTSTPEISIMSKISQKKKRVLDYYESRSDAWKYRDFENDLEESMGKQYGNYQTAKMTILEADRIGVWPKTVEQYVRTNFASFGNLPVELIPIGRRFNL